MSFANPALFLFILFFVASAHAQQATHVARDCGDAVFLYKKKQLYVPCFGRNCKTEWIPSDMQVTDAGNGKLLVKSGNYTDLICSRDRANECGCPKW